MNKKLRARLAQLAQSNVAKSVAFVGTSLVAVSAHAALPAEATAAFTTLQGNVTDVLSSGWPILALSVGGFALWKLFRRAGNQVV